MHAELLAAADGKDVWVVGGGDLAGQFADAGLLDEIVATIAPVTLGAGRPLFPRRYALRLIDVARNGAFACARYAVLGPAHHGLGVVIGRDRLRELLDAVLDEEHRSLADMAHGAYSSPFHFSRRLTRDAGEPPVAMRRRVALERAAWQLARGATVTDAAFAAGYGSVEGFARAFARAYGHPPSAVPTGPTTGSAHWLPAPNGIHFHAPDGLWVEGSGWDSAGEVTALLVHHDVDDVRALVELAKGLDPTSGPASACPG